MAPVGRDQHPVGAVFLGEARPAGAVEARAVEVALARVLLGGHEVDEARCAPRAGATPPSRERGLGVHHPVAGGHRPAGPRGLAQVDVGEARALGEPEEAPAILQEDGGGGGVQPVVGALEEHGPRGPQGRGGGLGHGQQAQLQLVLGAVQEHVGHGPAVGGEGQVGQHVDVVGGEGGEALGARRAVLRESHHSDLDHRVRVAGLGVALRLHLVVHGQEVHDGEGRHARLVELQVGHGVRRGRPPEGPGPAAGQLLLVDPVEAPVQHGVGARPGEAGLPARLEVGDEEVVLAQEGHPPAVRGELGLVFGLGGADDRARDAGLRVHHEEVAFRGRRAGGPRPWSRRARQGQGLAGDRVFHALGGEHRGLAAGAGVEGHEVVRLRR